MVFSELSANQLWKNEVHAGHTSLPFLDWLEREKTKAFFSADGDSSVKIPMNKPLNDSVQDAIKNMHTVAGEKTEAGTEYIAGIKVQYLYGSVAALAIITFGVLIYKGVI